MRREDAERGAADRGRGWGPTLRRPSDLAAEAGLARHTRRGADRHGRSPDGPPPVDLLWPEGYARTDDDRAAALVLSCLATLTARRLLELAQYYPTAVESLGAVRRGVLGSPADVASARTLDADRLHGLVAAAAARFVPVGDSEYPEALLDLHDPPASLFIQGRPPAGPDVSVAIVGSRRASAAGLEIAGELARSLARAGMCVVSGGARGIDAAGHRAALAAGGRSVAVLGCGLDVAYPRANKTLFRELASSGSLVSEYPPGTRAEPFRFPARNRLVAGLCRGVVIVEGAVGSGSLITADQALHLGREVFAVPGAVTNPLAAVPLELIREGATLIRGPEDLFGDLGLDPADIDWGPAGPGEDQGSRTPLSGEERAVLAALVVSAPPDHLARTVGLPLQDVLSTLLQLELRGQVRQVGGRYERRLAARSGRADAGSGRKTR